MRSFGQNGYGPENTQPELKPLRSHFGLSCASELSLEHEPTGGHGVEPNMAWSLTFWPPALELNLSCPGGVDTEPDYADKVRDHHAGQSAPKDPHRLRFAYDAHSLEELSPLD